jgi:hypothetical protein
LRFVILRQQIRGGPAGVPVYFFLEAGSVAICILTILSGSGTAPLSSQIGLRGHHCPHWQI